MLNNMTLLHGDCLELMKDIPDKSIDLIVNDPPYNIKKAEWDNIKNYIQWCGLWLKECERVLKDNGSFYFFHNDFLQIVDLQKWIGENTRFVFKQFIVWNKKYNGCKGEGFLQGFIEPEGLRNYQQMAEYILYYTFQDETGLKLIEKDITLYKGMREYCLALRKYIKYSRQKMINFLGNGAAQHFLEPLGPQWQLCTAETYQELIDNFNINKWEGFREYKSLRQEYKSLRQEYESLRYTFNNQKTHHSIWNYEIAEKIGHETPKPVPLLENILLHSSNENDVVLDCFMGSGSTSVACKNLKRDFIGIEKDDKYFEIAKNRIENHIVQQELYDEL